MKVRRLVVALGVIGIGVVAGCGISTPSNRGAREVREALLKELEPVALTNCTLKRYGSPNDGGYLMCENLVEGVQSAYSYGIASEDNWGCDVSRQFNVAVHQYDCFTPYRPVCDGGRFVFHDECVGARAETLDGQPFDTFGSHVVRNGDANKSLLVKIDIEGAEWDSLMATPDELLNNIAQMPMELHGADERKFLDVVRRLKRHFYLVNLHFNNWSCSADAAPLPATVYQVLWVNKRIGQIDESSPSGAPMSTLNAPDGPNVPDCQLR
jgi:hypothetical protein